MSKEQEILKAEAQILGWIAWKRGEPIGSLVTSMGLTPEEWEAISEYPPIARLTDEEIRECEQAIVARARKE